MNVKQQARPHSPAKPTPKAPAKTPVKTEPPGITMETVTVTPEIAREYLTHNTQNRRIKPASIEKYTRDMRNGEWHMTGEAIKFDQQGVLLDGQNRLIALIAADVPVDLIVMRGVENKAQQVMDSGVARSAADALTLLGLKNTLIITAAARFCLAEPALGYVDPDARVANASNSEVVDFIEQWPNIQRAAELSVTYRNFDAKPAVLTVSWMRLSEIDTFLAAEFFSSIANAATRGQGDPRAALVRRLATARRSNEKLTREAQISMIFRAWNAWMNGQELHKLMTESHQGPVPIPHRLATVKRDPKPVREPK